MIQVSEFECTERTAVFLPQNQMFLIYLKKNLYVSFRCLKVCNNIFRTLKYKEFTAYF